MSAMADRNRKEQEWHSRAREAGRPSAEKHIRRRDPGPGLIRDRAGDQRLIH
jgi:hypothetical protein